MFQRFELFQWFKMLQGVTLSDPSHWNCWTIGTLEQLELLERLAIKALFVCSY
jgi:hypothetical protein